MTQRPLDTSEGDTWREILAERRARRRSRRTINTEQLEASGHAFTVTNQGEQLMFREPGKPPVDFWPSTGRWRIPRAGSKTFNGGAVAFLAWYGKQVEHDS